MANVQHSTLTDPNIHEPKGVSTAAADQLYRSNGSGSGTWTSANRFPGTGWAQYRNATFVGTNTDNFTNTEKLVQFTEAVTVSQIPISLSGTTSPLMDISTSKLLFITTGDLHSITFTFKVYSTTGTPAYMNMLLYGSSDGITYNTVLGDKTITLSKGAGQVIVETAMFPVTANMVTHGAKIYLVTNTATANIIDIGVISARIHKAR